MLIWVPFIAMAISFLTMPSIDRIDEIRTILAYGVPVAAPFICVMVWGTAYLVIGPPIPWWLTILCYGVYFSWLRYYNPRERIRNWGIQD